MTTKHKARITGYNRMNSYMEPSGFLTPRLVSRVEVGSDGYVNAGATGCIDIEEFAQFAANVIAASNRVTGRFVGLPQPQPLENLQGPAELVKAAKLT